MLSYLQYVIKICSQRDLLAARRRVNFCYLCGKPFTKNEKLTRQHIPPQGIFAKADRDPPLILPSHENCNTSQGPQDEVIGQLVSMLHGKKIDKRGSKLEIITTKPSPQGDYSAVVLNVPIPIIIRQWARGFHAALYGEYAPDKGGRVYAPLPGGIIINGDVLDNGIDPERFKLTETFKQQLKAGRTDGVICYNGKCEYRCTWTTAHRQGQPITLCLFGLRLYNWEDLGDKNFPRMGCVGIYEATIPPNAARATDLQIPISNFQKLDPFAA